MEVYGLEEKKAIESFKEENNNDLSRFDDFNSYTQFKVKRDKLIIALIEKQSKEIELLKEENEKYKNPPFFDEDKYTENDKIKAKIEEIDFMIKEINQGHLQKYTVGELLGAKRFLESLLEKE